MNAGTIVGYITQPNGSPISGAEIWICEAANANGNAKNLLARTDARGYFQLFIHDCGADIGGIFSGGKLDIAVGERKGANKKSAGNTPEKHFRVTGYLISESLRADD